jgi:DNA invertase Pin-like site-specific DNA recombinase
MFRSALDALAVLGELKARAIALHMIDLGGDTTGNGVSKLVFTILSAVAEAERDRTRERIAEVKRDHGPGRRPSSSASGRWGWRSGRGPPAQPSAGTHARYAAGRPRGAAAAPARAAARRW